MIIAQGRYLSRFTVLFMISRPQRVGRS